MFDTIVYCLAVFDVLAGVFQGRDAESAEYWRLRRSLDK